MMFPESVPVCALKRNGTDCVHPAHATRNEPRQACTEVELPRELEHELRRIQGEFAVDTAKLKEIVAHFGKELGEGLKKTRQDIAMRTTWVFGSPTGHEKGQYLTIDLGGTNLRVCWITLKGIGEETEIEQDTFKLPSHVKTGSADELWGLIAECLDHFLQKHHLTGTEDEPLPVGFTFSYPVEQTSVDRGSLVRWTKGFEIKGVEGQDVALQLREALTKRKLPVRIVALINDTVGAMAASAYNDPKTIIGAIFGTGSNAAYMENVGSIPKIADCGLPPDTPMAINCEYGAFDNGDRILPRTQFDREVDSASSNPGEQAFEKMSAGLYLGEVFRLVIVDLYQRGVIFKGHCLKKLTDEPYILDTGFLSALENHSVADRQQLYESVLGLAPTTEELELSRLIAETIAVRGARLSACGIAAICKKKGIKTGNVAADGSVANKHPHFKTRWKQALGEILEWPADREEDPINMTSAEDGSGIGAAIITAMVMKNIRQGNLLGISDGGQYVGRDKKGVQ